MGEIWHQPVRHLAADESAANPGPGCLRETLRGFTSVARQRLAGLFCAATLLGGGTQGAKFSRLLNWWTEQNPKGRHLWPGSLPPTSVKAEPGRNYPPNQGPAHPACGTRRNLLSSAQFDGQSGAGRRRSAPNTRNPRSCRRHPGWIPCRRTNRSSSVVENNRVQFECAVGDSGCEPAWLWILQFRTNEVWLTGILRANQTTRTFENSRPELVAVSAVDRTGNLSSPAATREDTSRCVPGKAR